MKTILFGGFLGSGKTTLVMQLARYLVANANPSVRQPVIILENEIGEVGVDDMLLKSNGYQVSELFSGCACCTMAGELRGNVRRIQNEWDPEWLLMEATGVAYPLRIKETLDPIVEQPVCICALADAQRLLRMLGPARQLIQDQLQDASFIYITKTDLVDAETLQKVQDEVRKRNPNAEIFCMDARKETDSSIWNKVMECFS